jgi:hypothetical protein
MFVMNIKIRAFGGDGLRREILEDVLAEVEILVLIGCRPEAEGLEVEECLVSIVPELEHSRHIYLDHISQRASAVEPGLVVSESEKVEAEEAESWAEVVP